MLKVTDKSLWYTIGFVVPVENAAEEALARAMESLQEVGEAVITDIEVVAGPKQSKRSKRTG